jgi:transcription elongation factor GreA
MAKFPITKQAYAKLEQEVKKLKHDDRPRIIEAISTARDLGDLSENAEYHAAREQQSFVEGRILELEDKMARAEVIDIGKLSGDTVKFGATVNIVSEDTDEEFEYIIVGEYEADIAKQRISISSPLSRSLIGKTVGDVIEVHTPSGVKSYEILKISFKDFNI